MAGGDGGGAAFGALLRRYRLRGALSQASLAEQAGLSVEAVSVIERGRRGTPRPDTVALLARALNLKGEERSSFVAAAGIRRGVGTHRAGQGDITLATSEPHNEPAASVMVAASPAGTTRLAAMEAAQRLAGRTREQDALRVSLHAAKAGEGHLVLIGGEAGIGKSALSLAFQREAQAHGALLLTGHAYDLTETPPYGPWIELLLRCPISPELPQLPTLVTAGATTRMPSNDGGSQLALFAEVQSFLATLAARQLLVLLLEDMHWADPASLDLLRYVARECVGLPLLLLVTYRADEVTRRHALFGLLPVLAREGRALRLDLRRLDDEAVRTLLRERYGQAPDDETRLIAYLRARAEGNPLFVGELLRTLEEEGVVRPGRTGPSLDELDRVRVPPFLRQVIEGRLSRLGEAARALLAVAAIIGQEVSLALWQRVAGVDEDVLLQTAERAVETHVLVETGDGDFVRFGHALVREALYEGLLVPRRQAWHRRVGEMLAAGPAPDPDTVAYHFRQAGDERAVDWLIRAGERARLTYAWLTAAARFDAALALLPADRFATRRGALLGYLAWLRRYADPQRAVAHLDEGLDLAQRSGDHVLAASSQFFRGICRCYTGAIRAGSDELAAATHAVDALTPQERARLATLGMPAALLAHSLGAGTAALWLALSGRYREATALVERARAEEAGSPSMHAGASTLGDVYQALGIIHAAARRPDEARMAFVRARNIFEAVAHHYQNGTAAAWELQEVTLPYLADQGAELRRLTDLAEQAWSRSTGAWRDVVPAAAQLPVLLLDGHWSEGRRLAEEACAAPGTISQRLFAVATLGPLALYRGETDLAWSAVALALPDGPETVPGDTWLLTALVLQRVAVHLALDAGDLLRARSWLAAHDRWLAWSGCELGWAEGRLCWAAYHQVTGDIQEAIACAEQALGYATTPRQPLTLLRTHRLLGELASTSGKSGIARAHLATSLKLADACTAPFERALTLLALAEAHTVRGQHGEAAPMLQEARGLCERLQAGPALARLSGVARSLGVSRSTANYPAGLSTREVEVLRLMSTGLSNIEIAERLVLSPRTVEQHLRSIYNKIGVSSRSAATRFAVEQGLG